MWRGNNEKRCKILCIETAEEYLAKKQIKQALRDNRAYLQRLEIEAKGVCEGCGGTDHLRWVEEESYVCYDCYYEGMKQWGELYSYHSCRAEDMDGFIYDDEWEYLWEKENVT